VESGYANGHTQNPTYEQVCSGTTGHNEVVKLEYDTDQITLREILEIFYLIHDPTTLNRQGNDAGTQYRSGIYTTTPAQLAEVQAFVRDLEAAKVYSRPLTTEVTALQNYTAAEDYHQDFFERNPFQGYCVAVAGPKVAKFKQTFADRVKA
jgi:peptide-methionine (S)-S-oxide reductase